MDTKSFHLGRQPAPEALLKGVSPKGEFHEIAQSASEALLTGVVPTGEIHLEEQCASEGILKGVVLKGEFHENAKQAVISRLLCGELWGRALLEQPRITAFDFENPDGCAPKFTSLKKDAPHRGRPAKPKNSELER